MADFTNNVQTGVQSPITPQQGVQDNSVASALGGAGTVISGIGEGLFGASARASRAAIAKEHESSFIASYEQQQLKLADAVDQGAMSSDEARMRMRANFYKASAAFKGDPDDLARAHANIVNTTGLGKIIQTGTKQEQMQQALYMKAAEAGWINPHMSPDEMDIALGHYQQYQNAASSMAQQQAQLGLQRAKIGLETDKVQLGTARISQQSAAVGLKSSKLDLLKKQEEMQSRAALGQMQDAYNYKLASDFSVIKAQFDNHQIDAKQAMAIVDEKMATVRGIVGSVGAAAGTDYINNLTAPMRMRAEALTKYLSGEIDNKLLDAQIHNAEATQKLLLLGDKNIAELAGISQLLPNAPIEVQKEVSDAIIQRLRKNGSNDPASKNRPADILGGDDEERQANKGYLDTLKTSMSQVLSNATDKPEEMAAEVNQNLGNVLKGIALYGKDADAKDFNEVTDFLAKPDVGRYLTQHPLPAELVPQAEAVLRHQYKDVVMPLVAKELSKSIPNNFALVSTGEKKDGKEVDSVAKTMGQLVKPTFSGTGLVVVPVDKNNPYAVKFAATFNKDTAPIVNKLIRVSAHLRSDVNYKAAYDEEIGTLFPEEIPEIPLGK